MHKTCTVEIDARLIERLLAAQPRYADRDINVCVSAALEGYLCGESGLLRQELSGVAAELRMEFCTLLRRISRLSAGLDESIQPLLGENDRRYLSALQRNAEDALQYAYGLARRSQVSASEFRRQEVDVSTLAADIVAQLQREAPNRQVRVDISPGLQAEADPYLSRQLVEALLSNAWKFTSESPRAEIAVSREGSMFVIADNGIGFPQDQAESIIRNECRLHPARFPGIGFGLAIARRVVERHGGTIRAEGTLDRGARFLFNFGAE